MNYFGNEPQYGNQYNNQYGQYNQNQSSPSPFT